MVVIRRKNSVANQWGPPSLRLRAPYYTMYDYYTYRRCLNISHPSKRAIWVAQRTTPSHYCKSEVRSPSARTNSYLRRSIALQTLWNAFSCCRMRSLAIECVPYYRLSRCSLTIERARLKVFLVGKVNSIGRLEGSHGRSAASGKVGRVVLACTGTQTS